jgi:hypothetical protein
MYYYVFDTNVLLIYLSKLAKPSNSNQERFINDTLSYLQSLEELWLLDKAIFFIPNIILAETKKYIAESCIKAPSDIVTYRKNIKELVKIIEYRANEDGDVKYNMFINEELNRHHIINFCKVCEIESLTPPTKRKISDGKGGFKVDELTCSFVDMMLLAVAIEMKQIHKNNVFILSNDKRVRDICLCNRQIFPHCIIPGEEVIPSDIIKILRDRHHPTKK